MFEMNSKYNWLYILILVVTILLYTVTVILNGLGASSSRVFPLPVGGVSDFFYQDITPAGWVFSIVWTVIFIWQFLWLIYAFVNLFRRTNDGFRLYKRINIFDFKIFLAFAVNNIAIIIWLFVWTNKYLWISFVFILITALSLYVCLFFSLRNLIREEEEMIKLGLKIDIWLVRFVCQNGLGFFATWLTLATNLNFATALTWASGVEMTVSSTIALVFILVIVITYSILESTVWPKHFLYMFSPWFVLNFALIGSLAKNWQTNTPTRNNIISLILFIIIVLLTVSKISTFILYKTVCKRRIQRNQ